jgi:hypothetical protein
VSGKSDWNSTSGRNMDLNPGFAPEWHRGIHISRQRNGMDHPVFKGALALPFSLENRKDAPSPGIAVPCASCLPGYARPSAWPWQEADPIWNSVDGFSARPPGTGQRQCFRPCRTDCPCAPQHMNEHLASRLSAFRLRSSAGGCIC